MKKQMFSIVAAAIIASAIAMAGCSGQAARELPGESGTTVILVENTSISLPVKQLKHDGVELIYFQIKDRLVEFISSTLNNDPEGKSR